MFIETKPTTKSSVFNKSDSLATRVKKLAAIKESTPETPPRRSTKEVKTTKDPGNDHDVQFCIKVIGCGVVFNLFL